MALEPMEQYIAAFEEAQKSSARPAPPWVDSLRQAGIFAFSELGFPTTKLEAWKYTNVQPVVAQRFRPWRGAANDAFRDTILSDPLLDAAAPRMVFINGVYAPELAQNPHTSGVSFDNLSVLARGGAEWLSHLGRVADTRRNGFVALNPAFLDEGAVVHVAPGVRVPEPIQIIYASAAQDSPVVSYPRTLVVLGESSEASIVESYFGVNGSAYLCNAVTEFFGGEGAIAQHHRIQREGPSGHHVGMLAATLGRGARNARDHRVPPADRPRGDRGNSRRERREHPQVAA